MIIKFMAFTVRTEFDTAEDYPVTVWIEQDDDAIVLPIQQIDSLIEALIKAKACIGDRGHE